MASPVVFTAVRDLIEASFTDAPVVWPNEGGISDGSVPWVYVDVSGVLTRRIELGIAASEETGAVPSVNRVSSSSGNADGVASVAAPLRCARP